MNVIGKKDFKKEIKTHLKDINQEQKDAIMARKNESLYIVAGPGSGKTTVIALRVLKLVFVDDIDPINIFVTTFTKKAAAELRSRILGWGDTLKKVLLSSHKYQKCWGKIKETDFNRIITGTLDSIIEEKLGEYRAPGTPPPVMIEDFVSNAIMIRAGLFSHRRHEDKDLKDFLIELNGGNSYKFNVATMSKTLLEMKERKYHDQVNLQSYINGHPHLGAPIAKQAIDNYVQEMKKNLLYDFAMLEDEFLKQLTTGYLDQLKDEIQILLVDEYQDTNLLQEKIYMELSKAAIQNGGSISIVGDDDQSLYRFRGATVDLFKDYQKRITPILGTTPRLIWLHQNYRSTKQIVDFCNEFIQLDPNYQNARVTNKPTLTSSRKKPYDEYPILGMFRDNIDDLAKDLSLFINEVVNGKGVNVKGPNGQTVCIQIDSAHGSPSDIALLASSPNELNSSNNPRLPLKLRKELKNLQVPITVFNPRGQELRDVKEIQILCGLILLCLDPTKTFQNAINNLPTEAQNKFDEWRNVAATYIDIQPLRKSPRLRTFVNAWKTRTALGNQKWHPNGGTGIREVPIIDLIYKLVSWIPSMQNSVEGIVYLEAITRTVAQASLFGTYQGKIIFNKKKPYTEESSIKEAIWQIFVPLSTGAIEINEDLLDTLPEGQLSIMSVHQAKGLEFPLVIMDVGSDFSTKHWKQAFKRFPELDNNGKVRMTKSVNMEDEMRPHSPILKPQRSGLDRAFDDLTRKFFVGYSRAQDVLLLVGLTPVKDGYYTQSGAKRTISNIATGWKRDGNWDWGQGLPNLEHI